ncbi:hypothetical protein [Aquimarina pacifica]|uniref:hypothetical protein n=1 Tax=Aquimarina pacifica TaxID=1296415 RepID=UPI0004AD9896|nr:hypothetical protein [Aquimarina pacifica]
MNITRFYFMMMIITGFIIFYTLVVFIQDNPVSLRYDIGNKRSVKMFISQGFGFFTKDPKTDIYRLYKDNNGTVEEIKHENFGIDNSFGTNRRMRLLESKLEMVFGRLDSTDYLSPKIPLQKFFVDPESIKPVVIKFDHQLICGEYYLVKSKPKPWSLFSKDLIGYYPYKVSKMIFKCQ